MIQIITIILCYKSFPEELQKEGHIDSIIRKAISLGARCEDAYVAATYNASKYFGLNNFGRIEENCNADLVRFSIIIHRMIKKNVAI